MRKLINSVILLCGIFIVGGISTLTGTMILGGISGCAKKTVNPTAPTLSIKKVSADDLSTGTYTYINCTVDANGNRVMGNWVTLPCNCFWSSDCPLVFNPDCYYLLSQTPTPVASPQQTVTPIATPTKTFIPTDTFTPTFTLAPTDTFTPTLTPVPTCNPVSDACHQCTLEYEAGEMGAKDTYWSEIVVGSALCAVKCVPVVEIPPEYASCVGFCAFGVVTEAEVTDALMLLKISSDFTECKISNNCCDGS
jgi:hypothetical protein